MGSPCLGQSDRKLITGYSSESRTARFDKLWSYKNMGSVGKRSGAKGLNKFFHPRVTPAYIKSAPQKIVPSTTDPSATVDSLKSVLEDQAVFTYLRSSPFRFIGLKSPVWGGYLVFLAVLIPILSFLFIDYFLPMRNWVSAFVILGNICIFLGILGVAYAVGWKSGPEAFRLCSRSFVVIGLGMLVAGGSALQITFRAMADGYQVHRHSVIAVWLIWAIFIFLLADKISSVGRTVAGLYQRQREREEKGWIAAPGKNPNPREPKPQENRQDELPEQYLRIRQHRSP